MIDLIVIGGGPAGIFAAITFKTYQKNASVMVLEKTQAPLSKVLLSGGGRCNVTNGCFDPVYLAKNYPRGEKELIGPFHRFGPKDMISWLEDRKVLLKQEEEGRIFPVSNSSKTIKDALLAEVEKLKIDIELNSDVISVEKEENFIITLKNKTICSKNLLLATGSNSFGYSLAKKFGHTIEPPIPSLFAFKTTPFFQKLSGITVPDVTIKLKNTNFSQCGSVLFTHFGLSGPAIFKLSSFGAKYLFEKNYLAELEINWVSFSQEKIFKDLLELKKTHGSKTLSSQNIYHLPLRFWKNILEQNKMEKPLCSFSNKELELFSKKLSSDQVLITAKSLHKSEFVTCGGIRLKEIDFKTMESKICPHLYFAGEILDIDGLTGGFNFQNAWTTGFIAGKAISYLESKV